MLFCTLTYLIFLPIVFLLHWSMKSKAKQNYVLLAASMTFYGWWSWKFMLLMLGTCVTNFAMVRMMHRNRAKRKMLMWGAVAIDMGILGVFKYMNFFIENLQTLLTSIGLNADIHTLSVILPVGISFYTFQLVGYVIDNNKEADAESGVNCYKSSLSEFLTFICFFPQLVAGPIERAKNLLPQFQGKRQFSFDDAREGMRIILWGLAKKMLLADTCAVMVNRVFDAAPDVALQDLWLGALFFTFQIYGDFSGYSDIAIGSARLFGIRLQRNFSLPYFSNTLQEFWRRWHMSLMSWFKDYVYIPLGGSRRGKIRNQLNTLAVFSLSGLWHGANWTFICWGLYHGLLTRLTSSIRSAIITFLMVCIGWVIFRSPNITFAVDYITAMFTPHTIGPSIVGRMPLLYIALTIGIEYFMGKERLHPFCWKEKGLLSQQWFRLPFYAALFLFIIINGGEKTPFIYFQF